VIAILLALGGCGTAEPLAPAPSAPTIARTAHGDDSLNKLLDLMRQRLVLMHEVARWKWNEGKPISDPDRERQLLADLEQRGLDQGLSRQQTGEFMAAQIATGKLVQQADFAAWSERQQGKFADVRDLNAEVRPLIDRLSDQMLVELARLLTPPGPPQRRSEIEQLAATVLKGDGIDNAVRAAAIRPLLDSARD
jgi:chorismate mutase